VGCARPCRCGGEEHRCPERNIRADALDEFVFDHLRAALTEPALLLAGEHAVAIAQPIPDDELLAAELAGSTARSTTPPPRNVAFSISSRRADRDARTAAPLTRSHGPPR